MKIKIIHTEEVSKNTDILTVRREDGLTATVTFDWSTGQVYGPASPESGAEAYCAKGKTPEAINSVAAWE